MLSDKERCGGGDGGGDGDDDDDDSSDDDDDDDDDDKKDLKAGDKMHVWDVAADLPRTSNNRSAHSCAEHMVIMIRLDYSDDYDGAERDDHCPAH